MNLRGLPLLALTAVGCSLLIPLDYTGGREPGDVHTAGGTGGVMAETGGSVLGGEGGREDAASGGTDAESGMGGGGAPGAAGEGTGGGETGGSAGSGAAGSGGAAGGSGGDVSAGGTGGDTSGKGGDGGTAGTANAGGGGGTGGTAGRGGSGGTAGRGGSAGGGGVNGGMGGVSGMSGAAGMAGCTFDLDNDAMHCGSCTNACDDGVICEGGQCITAPCVGICKPSTIVPLRPGDGYRVDPVPKAGGCFEVPSYTPTSGLPAIVCWNFVSRTLEVNASTTACVNGNGVPLPTERAGGYCVKVGQTPDTCTTCPGFVLPISSSLLPSANNR